ncbi:hypothetical protein LPJ54_007149 [Coemansia sp. RSA 1824]|nr:hypothetical protein LPJ54_007149 [Coemansia sp. RSA 1824]
MSSYEGLAAMINMMSSDLGPVYGLGINSAISEAVNHKIIESFDPQVADSKYNETEQLPEYIEAMIPHQLSATAHTHIFYLLLAECLENMSPANEESIHQKLEELITAVCRREQTYLVARYIFHGVQQKLGAKAAGIRRIDDELETYMLDNYKRPQLAINIQLLLSGLVVGGGNSAVDAAASIIQEEYAATGDVASLYNEYHGAVVSGKLAPPVDILRNGCVLHPIIEQVFGHLWDMTVQKAAP